ncbi:hypothetical protein FRC02_012113 [Tulasnella sp. 418]|nr:hypothetical protein FRC02_012113 [Tulasnella sp. 418]
MGSDLNINPYVVSTERLKAFRISAQAVKLLHLSLNDHYYIAPEVFMALSLLFRKASLQTDAVFSNLQNLIISQDLDRICPYAFTPMFFPPSIRALTISNIGRVTLQTVFGCIASVGAQIETLSICGSVTSRCSTQLVELEEVRSIRILELKKMMVDQTLFKALSRGCPKLERLHIHHALFDNNWSHQTTFQNFQSLTFGDVNPSTASNLADLLSKSKFNGLRSLHISFRSTTSRLKESDLKELLQALKPLNGDELRSLALSLSETWAWITPLDALPALEHLEELEIKVPKGYMIMTDEKFKEWCRKMRGLKSLIIDAEDTSLTVNALNFWSPGCSHSLNDLNIPITASTSLRPTTSMTLPPTLSTLRLKVTGLKAKDVGPLAALLTLSCPPNAVLHVEGPPWDLKSSLQSTFQTLHTWKNEMEGSLKSKLHRAEQDRDSAIRERSALEIMIGNMCSDESLDEL